jgi:hypothetical protein
MSPKRISRRTWCNYAFGAAAAAFAGQSMFAQQAGGRPNITQVQPALNVFDKGDIWTMHFDFMAPRVTPLEVPGRGRKVVWYMWYQVINNTGEPRDFIPEFELVTKDKNTVHLDEIVPSAVEAIAKVEDPTGRDQVMNSITISRNKLQPSKPDAAPRRYTGIALWTDVYDKAADTNLFTVYVTGLSNGWTIDDNKVVRRKTLQLDFLRPVDAKRNEPGDIVFNKQVGPKWIYRASSSAKKAENGKAENGAKKDEGK